MFNQKTKSNEHTGSGTGEPHHPQMNPAACAPVETEYCSAMVVAAAAAAAFSNHTNISNSSSMSSMPPTIFNPNSLDTVIE